MGVLNGRLSLLVIFKLSIRFSLKCVKVGFLTVSRIAGRGQSHRAYLAYEIAAEALKKRDDEQAARETLTTVIAAASKADNTNERARTLLGVAHLFAKFDSASAFATMAEAIKTINRISEPGSHNDQNSPAYRGTDIRLLLRV